MANKETADSGVKRVEMVGFSNVRDMAIFAYVTKRGENKRMYMSRFTFEHIVTPGAYDRKKLGDMTSDQNEFMEILKTAVAGNLMEWFDMNANRCAEAGLTGI